MTTARKTAQIPLLAALTAALLVAAGPATASLPIPKKPPTVKATEVAQKKNDRTAGQADVDTGETSLPVSDVDENIALPDYPAGARIMSGEMKTYTIGEEDTLLDIARHFSLGYVELRAANPDVDPWAPMPGETMVIPSMRLLPRAKQEGILVNLGEMRLYYFKEAGKPPLSYPLGIGREGLGTPTGETRILRKADGPVWRPTERMRKEKTWLPVSVPPGAANPLGTHALYLGFPQILIHGSNKPWGIGRRVSSGCMRMYPEDIIKMFNMTPIGTKVTIVNQPIKIGWYGGGLYLEANPSMTQSNEIEIDGTHTAKPLDDGLKKFIKDVAGKSADDIDWMTVKKAVRERRGYPIQIVVPKKKSDADETSNATRVYN